MDWQRFKELKIRVWKNKKNFWQRGGVKTKNKGWLWEGVTGERVEMVVGGQLTDCRVCHGESKSVEISRIYEIREMLCQFLDFKIFDYWSPNFLWSVHNFNRKFKIPTGSAPNPCPKFLTYPHESSNCAIANNYLLVGSVSVTRLPSLNDHTLFRLSRRWLPEWERA